MDSNGLGCSISHNIKGSMNGRWFYINCIFARLACEDSLRPLDIWLGLEEHFKLLIRCEIRWSWWWWWWGLYNDEDDEDDDDVCTRPLVKWIQSDLRLDQTSTHQLATRPSRPHHDEVDDDGSDDDDDGGDDDDDGGGDDDGDDGDDHGDDGDDGPVKG